jgi:hypothetical protein
MRRAIVCIVTAFAAASPLDARQQPGMDGWVVLSLDDYRTLRSRAFPSPPDPAPPPVDSALTRIDYDLRAGTDTVSGEARLTVDVLKEGWVSIQIPAGMLVRGARTDGRPTALLEGKPPRVLISKPGRTVLALDVVVPITSAGGSERISVPRSGSAVSAVTLVIPREGVDLAVTGGFVGDETTSASETRWVVYGSPSQPMTVTWKRKVDDRRTTLPLKVRARITELVALGEESTSVTIGGRLDILQGIARDVELAMPDGLSINLVSGAAVADWRHEPGRLTVTFLEPVATETSFVINAELRAPRDGTVTIPLVRVPSADRETGGVAVDVVGSGEIADAQVRGLEAADASEVGDVVAGRESPSMAAFRYMPLAGTAPRSLSVAVSRYTPEAVLVANVEEARYDALVGEDGKRLVRARYAVRNNQRSFLAVTLPAGSTLWSAMLAGRPVRPGTAASGSFLLPLQKGRAGEEPPEFAVELVYLQRADAWNEKGTTRLELPSIDLPVSRTGFAVHHSPRFSVDLKPGSFRREQDTGPWSRTLATRSEPSLITAGSPAPPAAQQPADRDGRSLVDLLGRYRREAGRTVGGPIPIDVELPHFGQSIFMAAELAPESLAPVVELEYRRVRR